ncbi:MAG: hypothetical protein AB7T49_15095 [Oligoflexales bacterium]
MATAPVKKEKTQIRPARDEFEALKIVVQESPGLYMRVLNKLREHMKISKGNLLDEMKNRQVSQDQQEKRTAK